MGDTAGSPERARWLHLARSGSQSQRTIWFILPARGSSHVIRGIKSHSLHPLLSRVDRRLLLRLFSALTQLVATVIKNIQLLFDFVTVFFTGISGGPRNECRP